MFSVTSADSQANETVLTQYTQLFVSSLPAANNFTEASRTEFDHQYAHDSNLFRLPVDIWAFHPTDVHLAYQPNHQQHIRYLWYDLLSETQQGRGCHSTARSRNWI